MYRSISHTVYLLRVSATRVAIFNGGALQRIHGNITNTTEVLNQSTDISMCLSFVGHLLSFYICALYEASLLA
jgi:hypothetical protein